MHESTRPCAHSLVEPTVIALDFETADRGADSACALGLVRIEHGRVADSFYSLIRPPRRRVYFTEIHGITWNMVKDCPSFGELWPTLTEFLNGADFLAAHNASFDRRILRGCCEAAQLTTPAIPFLCTVKGARRGLNLPHNKLNDVCEHLGIELNHHNAESDALASAQIYLYLRQHGMDIKEMLMP